VSIEADALGHQLAVVLAAVDSAFADCSPPEKFTDHPYCDECAEAHVYFRAFTPASLAEITDPPETLPISFLTDPAFAYLTPGMLRWLPLSGDRYCVGDVLFHVENRLHIFDSKQRSAIRNLLYVVYDLLEHEIRSTAFDYSTIWRILNELEKTDASGAV
jgi:hypothetical protein